MTSMQLSRFPPVPVKGWRICDTLKGYAQGGPQLYPDDMTTDQSDSQVCAEIVREKILYCLQREVPHGVAIEVTKFSQRNSSDIIDLM